MTIDINELSNMLYTLSDNDVISLPTGRTASVREMTGHEQRSFMNRAKLTNGTAIQELLSACTISINDKELPADNAERTKLLLDMLSVDRRALMFGIRRHSLGSSFMFTTQCPSCRARETWEVNLADKEAFPVTPCPNGEAREHTYESKRKEGLKIRFNMLDGNAEMAVLRKRDSLDALTDLEMRKPSVLAMQAGKEVWIAIQLNKLPDSLIAELRAVVKAQEGDIRTTVKVICKKCEAEVEFDLLQLPDFMTPSVTS